MARYFTEVVFLTLIFFYRWGQSCLHIPEYRLPTLENCSLDDHVRFSQKESFIKRNLKQVDEIESHSGPRQDGRKSSDDFVLAARRIHSIGRGFDVTEEDHLD